MRRARSCRHPRRALGRALAGAAGRRVDDRDFRRHLGHAKLARGDVAVRRPGRVHRARGQPQAALLPRARLRDAGRRHQAQRLPPGAGTTERLPGAGSARPRLPARHHRARRRSHPVHRAGRLAAEERAGPARQAHRVPRRHLLRRARGHRHAARQRHRHPAGKIGAVLPRPGGDRLHAGIETGRRRRGDVVLRRRPRLGKEGRQGAARRPQAALHADGGFAARGRAGHRRVAQRPGDTGPERQRAHDPAAGRRARLRKPRRARPACLAELARL